MSSKTKLNFVAFVAILLLCSTTFSQETTFTYTCPVDGSSGLNPEQNIILKYQEGIDPVTFDNDMINISGSISGPIGFNVSFSGENNTLILKPTIPFSAGEKVHLSYSGGMKTLDGIQIAPIEMRFSVISHDKEALYTQVMSTFDEPEPVYNVPDREFPANPIQDNNLPPDYPPPTVYNYEEPDGRYFFYNTLCRNGNLPWEKYITIVDAYGTPVYYNKSNFMRHNFSLLPNGLLCYAIATNPTGPREKYFIMDSTFTVIDSINTGNGYYLDSHDMLLLDNGHYLVMSYDPQPVDMSQVVLGGDPNAIVTGLIIQEVDNNENVFFQWRSWDHFEITDATHDIDLTAPTIDYVHGNAFEIDGDGHILLSSRHLDEITKINFNTGDVIWRFGANSENNMFLIQNDPIGFSHQHDIRRIENGRYTIYDNGNLNNPQESRALEYIINQQQLTASLEWSYNHPFQLYGGSTGCFRVLEDDHRVIGWGSTWPVTATVVNVEGNMIQQLMLPDFVYPYRVLKYEWKNAVFDTRDELSLGNYAGHVDWKYNKLYIFNTCDKVVQITSTHHEIESFDVIADFPISMFPGTYKCIEIGFKPDQQNDFTDRFTLNFDNQDNTERIATQLDIVAYYDEEVPSVHFTPAYDSTGVSPYTTVSISFSEPVQKRLGGEIQNSDIPFLVELKETYIDGEPVPFSGVINEDKTLITLIPDQVLSDNQQYYVKLIGNRLVDDEEHVIRLDEESYFRTGMMTAIQSQAVKEFSLFPNPTEGEISLIFPDEQYREIKTFTASGKLIHSEKTKNSRLDIDLSDHPAGIYFINISLEDGNIIHSGKIIKH